MKAALALALFGALVVVSSGYCPSVPTHKCVKAGGHKKCSAVKVCDNPVTERCGNDWCAWPKKCASSTRTECQNFLALKEKCELKKACKPVKKPCGDGYCSLNQDCVKQTVCAVKHHYGRRLMQTAVSSSSAVAVSGGYEKPYTKPCGYCKQKEVLECQDVYSCVATSPCKEITVNRCVKDYLRPGRDLCYGGYHFNWFSIASGQKCGSDYCGIGYRCATVTIQQCKTSCGAYQCDYGYECVADYDAECKQYAYLETICRDVYEPTCVGLSHYAIYNYAPPCKTVYKCETESSVCGGSYCPAGYICAVDYKDSCNNHYRPKYDKYKPSKPVFYGSDDDDDSGVHFYSGDDDDDSVSFHSDDDDGVSFHTDDDDGVSFHSDDDDSSASASSRVRATDDFVGVDVDAETTGDGQATATGVGVSDAGFGAGSAQAGGNSARTGAISNARNGGIVGVNANARANGGDDDDDGHRGFFG